MIFVIVIVVVIVLWLISTYNGLVREREFVKNAMGQIAANVESRWDALKSIIDGVKDYKSHEAETLIKVVEARNGVDSQSTVKEVEKDDLDFANAMRNLNVVVERYPELKVSGLYENAMDKIDKYETNVKNSRMVFNDTVTKYNRRILTFPNMLIAPALGFNQYDYFTSSTGKENPPTWN